MLVATGEEATVAGVAVAAAVAATAAAEIRRCLCGMR